MGEVSSISIWPAPQEGRGTVTLGRTPTAAAMVRVSYAMQAVGFHEESRKGQHGQLILFILMHSQHAQGFLRVTGKSLRRADRGPAVKQVEAWGHKI